MKMLGWLDKKVLDWGRPKNWGLVGLMNKHCYSQTSLKYQLVMASIPNKLKINQS